MLDVSLSEQAAFIQTIRESPGDDTARLVYADWLEEHGDLVRADLIRVQCELARSPDPESHRRLGERETTLLALHTKAWLQRFSVPPVCAKFTRGFVEKIDFGGSEFPEVGADLFLLEPIQEVLLDMRYVDLREHDYGAIVARVADCPWLEWVTAIDFWQVGIDAPNFGRLMSSPYLGRVARLSLYCNEIGLEGVKALLASPSLKNLEHLGLNTSIFNVRGSHSENPDGNMAASLLAASPRMAHVKHLDLSDNGVGDQGATALLVSPYLNELRGLLLYFNDITDSVRERLVNRFGTGVEFDC